LFAIFIVSKKRTSLRCPFLPYYFAFLGIDAVCLVLDVQYNPAPKPIPVITDSAIATDPDSAIPNNGKNIFIFLLTLNEQ
jgi:hypothetical protein